MHGGHLRGHYKSGPTWYISWLLIAYPWANALWSEINSIMFLDITRLHNKNRTCYLMCLNVLLNTAIRKSFLYCIEVRKNVRGNVVSGIYKNNSKYH